MENNKSTVFAYYTLQMSTVTNEKEVELLDGSIRSIAQIKKEKNEYLQKSLTEKKYNFEYLGRTLKHRIVFEGDGFIVLRIANLKHLKAEKDFTDVIIENEPSILVVIQNIPEKQMIAIEKNSSVFSSVDAVAGFIENTLRFVLWEYSLRPTVRNIFDEKEIWDVLKQYNNRIKYIRFEFVKENNRELYKSLEENLKDFSDKVNSHKTVVQVTAPDNGVLEHITKKNEMLNGMIHTAVNGTSPIKIKVAGMKRTVSTRGKTVVKEFKNLEIDASNPTDALFILKGLFPNEG